MSLLLKVKLGQQLLIHPGLIEYPLLIKLVSHEVQLLLEHHLLCNLPIGEFNLDMELTLFLKELIICMKGL